jgi:hypothetical protein
MPRLNPMGKPIYFEKGLPNAQRKIETARKNKKIKLLDALDTLTDYAEMATEAITDRKSIGKAYDKIADFILENV